MSKSENKDVRSSTKAAKAAPKAENPKGSKSKSNDRPRLEKHQVFIGRKDAAVYSKVAATVLKEQGKLEVITTERYMSKLLGFINLMYTYGSQMPQDNQIAIQIDPRGFLKFSIFYSGSP